MFRAGVTHMFDQLLTSECWRSSWTLMPSVLRTVSFWPVLVVVSLSKQRVSPLVSRTTAFWAIVVRSDVKSKCTLLTGNTKSSYNRKNIFKRMRWASGCLLQLQSILTKGKKPM